jgi:hypothetical protein
MGLLNSHQILKGARTPAGEKTYTLSFVKSKPTASVATSILTLAGGVIEIEGKDYSLASTLDVSTLGTLVSPGQTFVVAAVAKYDEPASQAAAETAGLNYYIQRNLEGDESYARPFIPAAIKAAVDAAGGVTQLTDRIYKGAGSNADITLYNQYSEAVGRLRDPRYAIFPLAVTGFEFVLAQVVPQSNAPKSNALLGKSLADFNLLRSQLGLVYQERKVMTAAEAAARYTGQLHLIVNANRYSSTSDALTDTTPTAIAGPAYDFAAITPGTTAVAVTEYSYPSNLPIGQQGSEDKVIKFLTKENSTVLGRINPIYMYNEPISIRFAQKPASRLTMFGDPTPLVKITIGGTQGSPTVALTSEVYDMVP